MFGTTRILRRRAVMEPGAVGYGCGYGDRFGPPHHTHHRTPQKHFVGSGSFGSRRCRYACRLKMANAFFRMSRSRSTRRSSSSSWATLEPKVWAAGPRNAEAGVRGRGREAPPVAQLVHRHRVASRHLMMRLPPHWRPLHGRREAGRLGSMAPQRQEWQGSLSS